MANTQKTIDGEKLKRTKELTNANEWRNWKAKQEAKKKKAREEIK